MYALRVVWAVIENTCTTTESVASNVCNFRRWFWWLAKYLDGVNCEKNDVPSLFNFVDLFLLSESEHVSIDWRGFFRFMPWSTYTFLLAWLRLNQLFPKNLPRKMNWPVASFRNKENKMLFSLFANGQHSRNSRLSLFVDKSKLNPKASSMGTQHCTTLVSTKNDVRFCTAKANRPWKGAVEWLFEKLLSVARILS